MKGFVLATLFSAAYAGIVVAQFRASVPERRAGYMARMYLVSLPLLVACFALTPASLGFLPGWLTETNAWLDGMFCVFTYSASILGGWLQLYNVADRGLSLRILVDAIETPDGVLTPASLESGYGQNKGVRWMYGKRAADLEHLGLVSCEENSYVLSEKGLRHAKLIAWLRRLYTISTNLPGGR